MRSELKLQIYEGGDPSVFTVIDRSIYNPDITVECAQLIITSPGFGDEIVIQPEINFNLGLTSHSLGYTDINCENTVVLQDGIYNIKYQICPVDILNVEYNHLRQTVVLKKYYEALCSLQLDTCDVTKKQQEKLEKLKEIKQYLDAAKAYVEVCNNPKKGLELHNYAVDKLSNLNILCKTCN